MQEDLERAAVVREAESWIGTRYRAGQRVKGPAGGVDCLTFIIEVYERAGLIPKIQLPHYSQMWHLSMHEEKYLAAIEQFTSRVDRPGAGDLFLVKLGLAFSHAAIVLAWPRMAHASMGHGVIETNAENDGQLINRERKFYSFWR